MISVQQPKRKATCSSSTTSNNGLAQVSAGDPPKSSRKKTKLSASQHSSPGGFKVSQPQQQQQQQAVQMSSTDNQVKVASDGGDPHVNNSTNGNPDESVWIFGLINNIEQLLSSFSAVNNTSSSTSASNSVSTKLSSSSGPSTPSAPPSSVASSTAPSPPSAFAPSSQQLDSSALANSTCNTSTCTSSLISPTSASSSKPSSSCQPGAAPTTQQVAGASLPRSPISRQIKFHEYKGPPSAKRQQQQQQQQQQQSVAKQQSQQAVVHINNNGPTSSACLQPNGEVQPIKTIAPVATSSPLLLKTAQQQVVDNVRLVGNVTQPILQQHHQQQQQQRADQVNAVGQKSAISHLGPFSATIQQQQQRVEVLRNVGFQQNQMCANAHSLAAVKSQAHIMHQHAAQRHPHLSQPQQQQQSIQVTSGSQCNSGLQTFYIKQQSNLPLEGSPNGSALLLAPLAVEQSSKQLDLEYQRGRQFEQMQQHLQFPIGNREQQTMRNCGSLVMSNIQQPSNNAPLAGLMIEQSDYREQLQHCGQQATLANSGQAANLVQLPTQQRLSIMTGKPNQQLQIQQQQQQQVQYTVCGANANYIPLPTTCAVAAASANHQQLIGYANDQFGANSDGYSPLTSQQIDEDELTASFGPDSEETDACDIEPSIGFASGIDELLFSEFIDLQDVPMNVNESDWLKKFLPPCSMG